jgi:hypothetical protein
MGEFMYQQNLDAALDTLVVMAELRRQNAEFCQRLRFAIEHGMERCPTGVDKRPGTRNPVFGYTLD